MSKEKTIPDPPAHIKRWIEEQWEQNEDYNQGSRPTYSFRQGASVMYQKDQEELEERSVGFAEWIQINGYVGTRYGFWFDSNRNQIATATADLYQLYLKYINQTPTNGK